MPTNSIFSKFEIKDDKTMENFLKKVPAEEKRKIPKIDIQKKIERGRKVLESF